MNGILKTFVGFHDFTMLLLALAAAVVASAASASLDLTGACIEVR